MSVRTDERGFTMVTMMGVILFLMALVFATYSVADGDLAPAKKDVDRKIAYAAAEAGIQNYVFHLLQNDDYWSQCTNVPAPHAVNQRWSGSGTDTRTRWLNVPESSAQYAIELLPANGYSACVPGDTASMIDNASRAIRIRSTGRTSAEPDAVKRSIVATLRRESFLDYLWFTDYEVPAPPVMDWYAGGYQTREDQRPGGLPRRNLVQFAAETCGVTYNYRGRSGIEFRGTAAGNPATDGGRFIPTPSPGAWQTWTRTCPAIPFLGPTAASGGNVPPAVADTDVINGPLHSNDDIAICGHARFGRYPQDRIEVSGPGRPLTAVESAATVGWRVAPGCGVGNSAPNVNMPGETQPRLGTWVPNARTLTLPSSNSALRADTQAGYRFVGRTIVRLDGAHMFVSGRLENGTVYDNTRIPAPSEGVLYVSNASCGSTYRVLPPYPAPAAIGTGCGDLELQGTYGTSLTLAAENDILITEDVLKQGGFAASSSQPTPAPDVLLGLIANGFIRLYHPVNNVTANGLACQNNGGPGPDLVVHAAILSVGNSFINDFYFCGAPTGKLTVVGAIGQKYRGSVVVQSQQGANIVSGYRKEYVYDDRFRYRSPPHFIDPVGAGWQVQTFAEQTPAT